MSFDLTNVLVSEGFQNLLQVRADDKTIYEAFRKSDKLALDNMTLIGSEGFKIIYLEGISSSSEA